MTIPPELPLPTRSELIERHKRFRTIANPEIDTGRGTEPDHKARVSADMSLPIYAATRNGLRQAFLTTATGEEAIEYHGDIEGVPRPGATSSLGFVKLLNPSIGGAEIQRGEGLHVKGDASGPRFECTITASYQGTDRVPVVATTPGVVGNLPAGTILEWDDPPGGIGPLAEVVEVDGRGISGGFDRATPEEHKAAILSKKQDPPGAENDAHYRAEMRRAGVAMTQTFAWPLAMGPGVIGLAFTVPPLSPGGSRVPTEQQEQLVDEHLRYTFGADDSHVMLSLVEFPRDVAMGITWRSSGWVDGVQWPQYRADGAGAVKVTSVTDALNFQVGRDDATTDEPPEAGQTIALFDRPNARFAHKRIASVSGSGPWDIEVDTTNRVSDESYEPSVGDLVSPWSPGMSELAGSIVALFRDMGPGETVPPGVEDFERRRRRPVNPDRWPSALTEKMLEDAVGSLLISDRQVLAGASGQLPGGVPGTIAYMLTLGDLALYPKAD